MPTRRKPAAIAGFPDAYRRAILAGGNRHRNPAAVGYRSGRRRIYYPIP